MSLSASLVQTWLRYTPEAPRKVPQDELSTQHSAQGHVPLPTCLLPSSPPPAFAPAAQDGSLNKPPALESVSGSPSERRLDGLANTRVQKYLPTSTPALPRVPDSGITRAPSQRAAGRECRPQYKPAQDQWPPANTVRPLRLRHTP